MARRSSGDVNVDIKYVDSKSAYRAVVTICKQHPRDRTEREVVWVDEPHHLTQAVDSPKAYDEAARAAITFAERINASSYADWGGNRLYVRRKGARCPVRRGA